MPKCNVSAENFCILPFCVAYFPKQDKDEGTHFTRELHLSVCERRWTGRWCTSVSRGVAVRRRFLWLQYGPAAAVRDAVACEYLHSITMQIYIADRAVVTQIECNQAMSWQHAPSLEIAVLRRRVSRHQLEGPHRNHMVNSRCRTASMSLSLVLL